MARLALEQVEQPVAVSLAPHARAIGALGVFIVALTVFALTLPTHHTGDDLQYAMIITREVDDVAFYHPVGNGLTLARATAGEEPASTGIPINPRYLLEWPTSMAVYELWKLAGWDGDALIPIQMSRAVVGAVGATLLFFMLVRLVGVATAAIAAIGVALSASYWTYGTTVDQSINFVVLLIAALLLASSRLRRGAARWLDYAIPGVLGLATLYNFTAVVGAGVIGLLLVAYAYAEGRSWRAAARLAVVFAAVYSLTIVVPITGAVAWQDGAANLVDREYWRRVTFAGHPEYELNPARDLLRSGLSFGKAQIAYPPATGSLQEYWDAAGTGVRLALLGFYAGVLAIMAVPVLALAWLRGLSPRRPLAVVVLACLLGYAAFSFWWDPGYIKYWIVPVVCWWVLVALTLHAVRGVSPRWHVIGTAAVVAFIMTTFLVNLWADDVAANANGDWQSAARALRESRSEDLFISLDGHPLDFYIAYTTRRDIVSLRLVKYSAGGDESVAYATASERVQEHLGAGGEIYFYAPASVAPEHQTAILDRLRLTAAEPVWAFEHLTVFRAVREHPP